MVLDRLRSTVVLLQLPQYLWCYILSSIVDLVNSTAVTNKDLTPYQAFFDELEPGITHIPDLGWYKAIGSRIELLIPNEKRPKSLKLQARTEPGRLLAALGNKTCLVWIPARRAVVKSPFVKIVDENDTILQITTVPSETSSIGGYKEDSIVREGDNIVDIEENPTSESTSGPREPTDLVEDLLSTTIVSKNFEPSIPTTNIDQSKSMGDRARLNSEPNRPTIVSNLQDPIMAETILAPPVNPLSNMDIDIDLNIDPEDRMQLNSFISSTIYYLSSCYKASKGTASEPQTLKQVYKSQDKDRWLEAIYSEFDQLVGQGTFKFLPYKDLPKARKPLTSRLVLKAKKNKDNQIVKYKARLVVRGFQQIEGLDFNETFASTTIPPSWRVLLAIAAIEDWEIEQIDFIGAFLNGELEEENYMQIPDGFIDYACRASKSTKALLKKQGYNPKEDQVILLSKALYGLKQSPRLWQTNLSILLRKEGFEPLVSDSAIFYNPTARIFIVTYVDDYLLIGPDIKKI